MEQDLYTLQNGEKIKLSEIYEIGKLEDNGENRHNFLLFKWSFTITFKNRDIKNVEEAYRYSDWGEARKKLEEIRDDLIQEFENY